MNRMGDSNIIIAEKPEFITWDDIHICLWNSHKQNRSNGVIMSFPSLPGEKLREKIESGNGKLYVALDGRKVVGTAGFTSIKSKNWFCKGEYAYLCLGSILPEYSGRGVYKQLCTEREKDCLLRGFTTFVFETHEKNLRVISVQKRNGFHLVSYKRCKDGHHNVVMAKWIGKTPRSYCYYTLRFYLKKFEVKILKRITR